MRCLSADGACVSPLAFNLTICAITDTLGFAARAGVKRLVTFHHDPGHDDATLDRLIEEAHSSVDLFFEIIPGTEGVYFDLGVRSSRSEATA